MWELRAGPPLHGAIQTTHLTQWARCLQPPGGPGPGLQASVCHQLCPLVDPLPSLRLSLGVSSTSVAPASAKCAVSPCPSVFHLLLSVPPAIQSPRGPGGRLSPSAAGRDAQLVPQTRTTRTDPEARPWEVQGFQSPQAADPVGTVPPAARLASGVGEASGLRGPAGEGGQWCSASQNHQSQIFFTGLLRVSPSLPECS